jgi:regulatory protein
MSIMAVITSIKQQKDKNRVSVYLDNKFGFGIDLDNFVLLNLKINQELNERQIEEIIKKAEFQKTLDKLLKWVMGRPHSEKEIYDYLRHRKVPNVIHKELFSRLKYFNLLDDEEFARRFVEDRQRFRPRSKRNLDHELKNKGISKEIIDKVLNEIEIDEGKIALDLLKSRRSHWGRVDSDKLKQKMLAYLVSKGFGFEVAKRAAGAYNMREDEQVK